MLPKSVHTKPTDARLVKPRNDILTWHGLLNIYHNIYHRYLAGNGHDISVSEYIIFVSLILVSFLTFPYRILNLLRNFTIRIKKASDGFYKYLTEQRISNSEKGMIA